MVRQWQEMFYDERYSEVYLSPDTPDYVKWAEAMGCVGIRVESPEEVEPAIEKANSINDRPVVVEFRVDAGEKVFPMVPAGLGNDDLVLPPSRARRKHSGDERVNATPLRDGGRSSDLASRIDVRASGDRSTTTTSCRCSCRTGPACWPAWRACSPGAASTSSRWPSRRPRTDGMSRITIVVDVESTPLEQITKQLFKLIEVVKISELDPRSSVERELLLATVRATPEHRSQVVELVNIFEAKILAVGAEALTVSLEGHPTSSTTSKSCSTAYGIVELQRTGRVALPKLDRQARLPRRERKGRLT